jgi:hypothetical protein
MIHKALLNENAWRRRENKDRERGRRLERDRERKQADRRRDR